MRTQIRVYAALLSLGFVITAWASPSTLPVSPAQEEEMPRMNKHQKKPVIPSAPSRGQMLYENHCMSCHESVVLIRSDHRTQSLTELRGTVSNWVNYLHLHWGREEVEEVVTYLNNHYYRFESR